MPGRPNKKQAGLAGTASVILSLALFFFFLPTTFGGSFSYAIINGNSMAPLLATDDIVLLRSASNYEVGDAVAYRHPQIGNVLHRIIADDGERFTLRGDNRDGSDSYNPTREDIVGRQWIIIPRGGAVARELQTPRNLLLLVAATIVLAVGASAAANKHRRPGLVARRYMPLTKKNLSIYSLHGRRLAITAGGCALGGIVLFSLWQANGPTREITQQVPFVGQGEFAYGGIIEGGVYDSDTLSAPEPLYRQLTNELPLFFDYSIDTSAENEEITNALGSYQLLAEVSTGDRWKRTVELQPATRFAGSTLSATTTIDLAALDEELAIIAEQTGIEAGSFVIQVIARVQVAGQLVEIPFEQTFQQLIQFRLTPLSLQLDSDEEGLVHELSGGVSQDTFVPRALELPMLPISIPYSELPLISGALGLLAITGLATVGIATLITFRGGEPARIRARYGALLIDIGTAADSGPRPMSVGSFVDLARLAAAEGLTVMHRRTAAGEEYFVTARDARWRYAEGKPAQVPGGFNVNLITTGDG